MHKVDFLMKYRECLDQEKALMLLEGIYSTVIVRDVLERESRRGQKKITDPALENVVYFELLRRGFDVAIGKIDNSEVDFIAKKADSKLYVQVTESMTSEEVRVRELAPLEKINDNYEKKVLSLNPGLDSSYEGIKSISIVEWLLEE